jgi:hypothetical protein
MLVGNLSHFLVSRYPLDGSDEQRVQLLLHLRPRLLIGQQSSEPLQQHKRYLCTTI